MDSIKKDYYKLNIIKFLLIFFVIFGHLIEMTNMEKIYLFIYTFHMPVFIFLCGFLARFDKKKVLNYIYIYIISNSVPSIRRAHIR